MTGHNRDNKVPADHLKVKRSIDKAEARRREEWVEKTLHNIEVLEEADWTRNEELTEGDRDFEILKRWVYAGPPFTETTFTAQASCVLAPHAVYHTQQYPKAHTAVLECGT